VHDPGPRWSAAFQGMPWATLLPLLSLLPLMLSGAVRYTFGSSFVVSLAIPSAALVILAGMVYLYGLPRIEPARSRVVAPAVFSVAVLGAAFSYELWWTPLFGGLPNTFEGVDIGNHLLIYQKFVQPGGHRQYAGFVSMYSVMHWYRVLFASAMSVGPSYWHALRFAHYAFLLVLPVASALVVYPVLARIRDGIQACIAALLCLPLQLSALGFLLFPVVAYYQAEGFYSQIAGLYPLVFGWLCFGLIEHAGARFAICCLWLVVQRFSYGLNMGDLLLTLAYLWAWEARAIQPRVLRWAAWAFVPVSCYGAYVVLRKLWRLRFASGYFIEYPEAWVIGSMLGMGLLLLVAASFFKQRGVELSAASERLWRYAGVNAWVSGVIMLLYLASGAPPEYYFQKYSLYASVLLALAAVGPLSTLVAHLVTEGPRWLLKLDNLELSLGTLSLASLTLFGALCGYRVYQPLASERWHHNTPSAVLYSNYEPEIQAFIEKTLREKKSRFGGYYDTFWPRMFTHNALYFFFSHARDHYFNYDFLIGQQMFSEDRGECIFVTGTPAEYLPGTNTEMGRQLRRLYNARDTCNTYQPAWSNAALTVCAACM
jgi:hypothetical protein